MYTPKKGILHGITRQSVIKIAVFCKKISIEMLNRSLDVFIILTAGGVIPVKKIDGKKVFKKNFKENWWYILGWI